MTKVTRRLPNVPLVANSSEDIIQYLRELVRILEKKDLINSQQYLLDTYTVSSEINPSTITTEELANVVCTLLKDLAENGIIDAREA